MCLRGEALEDGDRLPGGEGNLGCMALRELPAGQQRPPAHGIAKPRSLQQILQQTSKEHLFRDGDENEKSDEVKEKTAMGLANQDSTQ